MSPLLRALTYSRTAHEPITAAMLLQCYTAVDAFRRGQGSRDLHLTLSRHLLVSQELARLGLGEDVVADIESAHAAMVRLDAREHHDGVWILEDSEYARLCTALAILDGQLARRIVERDRERGSEDDRGADEICSHASDCRSGGLAATSVFHRGERSNPRQCVQTKNAHIGRFSISAFLFQHFPTR